MTQLTQHVAAPPDRVYAALLDPAAVRQWMVPDGMTSEVHAFDPREGGTFRISLTYDAPTDAGKTTDQTDTFSGRFVRLVPGREVVQRVAFETDDPALAGDMTITYLLAPDGDGTLVTGRHDDLPPGLSPADNATGWRMSMGKLARLLEQPPGEGDYATSTVRRAREVERASPGGRLPLPAFTGWPSFPYEGELRIRAVGDVELPEPPRHGEGGVDCGACAATDDAYLWTDDTWRVKATDDPTGMPVVLLLEPRDHLDLHDLPAPLQAGLGPVLLRVEAALRSLGGVARVHVLRIGDGAEHLHWWFFVRPLGLTQARGSLLVEWDDVLPPRPRAEWEADLRRVAAALSASEPTP